jgi:hypothetical protein
MHETSWTLSFTCQALRNCWALEKKKEHDRDFLHSGSTPFYKTICTTTN